MVSNIELMTPKMIINNSNSNNNSNNIKLMTITKIFNQRTLVFYNNR